MNKVFSAAFLVALLSVTALNVTAQIRKIPAEVTDTFSELYPGATKVEWRDRLKGFSANFTKDDTDYVANFSNKGAWESTENVVDQEAIPQEVTGGFEKSKYAEWEILQVTHIELPDDNIQYRIQVGKGDIKKRNLLFNSEGRLVKDNLTL